MRKNLVIERFHIQLEAYINLAAKFVEKPEVAFMIRSCRMKPKAMMTSGRKIAEELKTLTLQKEWFDEWGNSVAIQKNSLPANRVGFNFEDLTIERDDLSSSDIYFGLSLENVKKVSRVVMVSVGIDEDFLEPCCLLSFLGLDGFLRSHLLFCGEWNQVSPLYMGEQGFRVLFKTLQKIDDGEGVVFKIQQGKEKSLPTPCFRADQWISCLPVSKEFLETLKKGGHEMLAEILKDEPISN